MMVRNHDSISPNLQGIESGQRHMIQNGTLTIHQENKVSWMFRMDMKLGSCSRAEAVIFNPVP